MAKRQTRRSISVAGKTYARIELARKHGVIPEDSISGYIERLIAADLDQLGVPLVEKAPPREKKKPEAEGDEIASQHFTF